MITPGSSDNAAAIADLHWQIVSNARKSLELAMQIGELLQLQKQRLQHGQWGNWIRAKLPFTQRTANNYVRLHRIRDHIKLENVSNLTEAYDLLTGPAPMDRSEAERISAQILDILHSLATETVTFVDTLRRTRDHEAYAPEFPTFEAYLASLGMTSEDFRAREQLCDALKAWISGGSAAAVFKCLRPERRKDEGTANGHENA